MRTIGSSVLGGTSCVRRQCPGTFPGLVEGELVELDVLERGALADEHARSQSRICSPASATVNRRGQGTRDHAGVAAEARRSRDVLKEQGIHSGLFDRGESRASRSLPIVLKYFEGRPVIEMLKRVSRPGLRVYKGRHEIPKVMDGLGHCDCLDIEGVDDGSPGPSGRSWGRGGLYRGVGTGSQDVENSENADSGAVGA